MLLLAFIVGGVLTAEFYTLSYNMLKIVRYDILFFTLVLIAWIDQSSKRIPNKILLVLLEIRGVLLVLEWTIFSRFGMAVFASSLLGALLGGGMFLFAHFIAKGGVGMGDVKLFAVIGSYMGSGSIMTVIFLTVIVSAIYSIIMLTFKKIKLKEEIPFAPFILVGTILTMALGI